MTDENSSLRQARPYIAETPLATSLHFAGHEIQSQMWKHAPDALALEYTQTMMGFMLFNPQPEQITMIGLGGGSLAKFCHRHLPAAAIEVVEINSQVVDLRSAFKVPGDDERFRVVLGDGADTVGQARQSIDVLLVDGYDHVGIPTRLASAEFYLNCRRALRPHGLMVANIVAAHPNHGALMARIRAAFGDSVLVVHDSEGRNDIVFAWLGDLDDAFLADHGRPTAIRSEAWDHLIPAMDRVRFAWRDRRRGTRFLPWAVSAR